MKCLFAFGIHGMSVSQDMLFLILSEKKKSFGQLFGIVLTINIHVLQNIVLSKSWAQIQIYRKVLNISDLLNQIVGHRIPTNGIAQLV
jgi:hypothetical protein